MSHSLSIHTLLLLLLQKEEKSTRLDSQTMVHELKSVLYKRINELDLEGDQ